MTYHSRQIQPSRYPVKLAGLSVLLALGVSAQTTISPRADFDVSTLSLEELLQVKVTSVSRKSESLFGAPAAVYAISAEDIHRLGATDLPSALRAAPGVQVGRISNKDVALSPRGFNGVSANKLLALVDGRSIYSPLFAGVQYRSHDMVMQDIERIEVIRGPGATLWGANAVNGVINVTTKTAHETLGTLVSASVSDEGDNAAVIRHGFAVDKNTDARVWALYQQHPSFPSASSRSTRMDNLGAGLRLDRRTGDTGTFTLIADWSESRLPYDDTTFNLSPPYITSTAAIDHTRSGSVLARLHRTVSAATRYELQGWVEYRDSVGITLNDEHWVSDLEFTVQHAASDRHEIVAGLGGRLHTDEIGSSDQYQFDARTSQQSLFTGFIQDEITLIPDHFSVTAGTKVEHNAFTGFEVQPGLRATWRETQHWTLWASVARAVRTPARAERGTTIYPQIIPPNPLNPLPTLIKVSANPNFGHESLLAWEAGWRLQLNPQVSFDVAAYLNDYDGIRSVEPMGSRVEFVPVPHVIYESMSSNGIRGQTRGMETVIHWQPVKSWRLQASWATITYDLELAAGSMDTNSLNAIPGSSPRHEFKLFSQWNMGPNWSIDAFIRHQTELTAVNVPAYTGMNLRLAWRPRSDWEVELLGQDLFDPKHAEFPPTYLGGSTQEVPRSVRLSVTWRH